MPCQVPVPEPVAQQARDHDRGEQVEADHTETEPHPLVRAGERHEGLPPPHVDELVDRDRDGVHGQERDGEQSDVAVHGLRCGAGPIAGPGDGAGEHARQPS